MGFIGWHFFFGGTVMSCPRGCCPDYKTHIRGVRIGGLPTQTTYTERHWERDMAAFKSMHDQGLNPARLDGAAAIERSAKNEREIKMGRPLDKETHALFDDAGL